MGYQRRVQFVERGASATAGNINTPSRQLHGNIEYLREQIASARLGQALFAREVPLTADCAVGHAVYWDAANGTYDLAIAGYETRDGEIVPSDSSQVVGIVYSKASPRSGDLLILGYASVDLSNAVSGDETAGRYYLSGTTAGLLTQTRPAAAVPVLQSLGNGYVLVNPFAKDSLEDHVHRTFYLKCRPAGSHTPPSPGGTHSITGADDSIEGWLPADHAVFEGKAPSGAAFGYNLAANAALQGAWPPTPLTSAIVFWDKGADLVGGTETPQGHEGAIMLTAHGIFWMSNAYGDVPWPTDWTAEVSLSSQNLENPREEEMRLRLDFVQMSGLSDKKAVTSIRSLSPLLSFTDCEGNEAQVGDICANLDLLLALANDEDPLGSEVVKTLNDSGQLVLGRVIEGVKAGSNITLSSTHQRYETPGDTSSAVVHQGLVTIHAATGESGQEFYPTIIRVDDAVQRFDGSVMYVSLMPNHGSSVRGRIDLPASGLPANPQVFLKVRFLATEAGTPPAITLTARNIPAPTGSPALPSGDTAVTFNVPAVGSVAAGDYFEITSAAIAVTAGGSLYYTISREGNDGYSGELGILRDSAVLV